MTSGLSWFQFVTFAGVGAFGTAAHYAVLVGLVHGLDVRPVTASIFGYLTGAVVNYILAYRYAFRSAAKHRSTLPRFLLIAAFGFLVNAAAMWTFTERLSLPYLAAQMITTTAVLFINYIANALWTFSGDTRNG